MNQSKICCYNRLEAAAQEEFIAALSNELLNRRSDELEIEIGEVLKNNGIRKESCIIRPKGCRTAPVLYPEDFYPDYRSGRFTVSQLADRMLEMGLRKTSSAAFGPENLDRYEDVRGRILPRLINAEKNIGQLENVPYVPVEDLAVVFYYSIPDQILPGGSFLIRNEEACHWKVQTEQLYQDAVKGGQKLRPLWLGGIGEILGISDCGSDMLTILTNTEKAFGASAILYPETPEILKQRMGGDFYLLPSSVHELLLVSGDFAQPDELRKMVREVNRQEVAPEEVLSDNVYLYDIHGRDFHLV